MAEKRPIIFMTGASGYIGSRITAFALEEGYDVVGLARSDASMEKIRKQGGTPVKGDVYSLDVLTEQSAKADAVIHLADTTFEHRDNYAETVRIDKAVVDAIAAGLKGTNKPLLIASGSMVVSADPNGGLTDENSPRGDNTINDRLTREIYCLEKASLGIRTIAIRLAPYVFGRGGSGVALFMQSAAQTGASIYIDDGSAKTTAVHVDDAARMCLLAVKKGRAGQAYNATCENDVSKRLLAEAIADCVGVPAVSMSAEELGAKMPRFFVLFLQMENRASNAKSKRELGWEPKEIGILEDIKTGSYVAVGEVLRKNPPPKPGN